MRYQIHFYRSKRNQENDSFFSVSYAVAMQNIAVGFVNVVSHA